MRMLLKAKYIILSVLFLVVLIVGTKYGWLVQRYTFAQALQNQLVPTMDIENDLRRCFRTCDVKDKAFAHRVSEILESADKGETPLRDQFPALRKILTESAQRYADDGLVRSAVEVLTASMSLNEELLKDSKFQEEIYIAIEKLAARNPRNGHVYFAKGLALFQKNPHDENAIAAFRKCLLILPTESQCRDGYEKAVTAYTNLRCPTEAIEPSLAFNFVENGKPETLFSLAPTEISEMVQTMKGEHETLQLRLKEGAQKRLQPLTAMKSEIDVQILKNAETLTTLTVDATVLGDRGAISAANANPADAEVFERLCTKPVQLDLPKSLRL